VTGHLAGLEGTTCTSFVVSLHTISISSLGYYPPSDTVDYTEDSPPSSANELTRLCNDWENSADLPEGCKTRLVKLRIGVVMGRTGGIIQQSIWPFWLGLGGKYLQFVVVALHSFPSYNNDIFIFVIYNVAQTLSIATD